ncbi:MAG: hypothetical protein ACLQVG_13520, partial [Terriglobia bacterium]
MGTIFVPAAHGPRREIDTDPEGATAPLPAAPVYTRTSPPPKATVFGVGKTNDRPPWAAGTKTVPLPTAT